MTDGLEELSDGGILPITDSEVLKELVSRRLQGRMPREVGDYFLSLPFQILHVLDPVRLAVRAYVETQPEEFRDKFDSYVGLKAEPLRQERTSDSWEFYCA